MTRCKINVIYILFSHSVTYIYLKSSGATELFSHGFGLVWPITKSRLAASVLKTSFQSRLILNVVLAHCFAFVLEAADCSALFQLVQNPMQEFPLEMSDGA